MKNTLKIAITALSIAVLTACGGGDSGEDHSSHSFLSVDNTSRGVVCVEGIGYIAANSAEGQQVARDLVAFYGVGNPYADPLNVAYSAPTHCGGATANPIPAPDYIIPVDYYYNVIVPAVR